MLKNCFVGYVDCESICTREEGSVTVGRTFLNLEGRMLFKCRSLLASFEEGFIVPGLLDSNWKEKLASQINGLINSDSVHGTPEGKDFQCNDMFFSFGHMDKATGYIDT